MRLADATAEFSFDVLAYQYPTLQVDPYGYDRNWLTVRVETRTGGQELEFEDSCLLTWELDELRTFLQAACEGEQPRSWKPVEPTIRLSWADGLLHFDISTPGAAQSVEFSIRPSLRELQEAVKALAKMGERFPQR